MNKWEAESDGSIIGGHLWFGKWKIFFNDILLLFANPEIALRGMRDVPLAQLITPEELAELPQAFGTEERARAVRSFIRDVKPRLRAQDLLQRLNVGWEEFEEWLAAYQILWNIVAWNMRGDLVTACERARLALENESSGDRLGQENRRLAAALLRRDEACGSDVEQFRQWVATVTNGLNGLADLIAADFTVRHDWLSKEHLAAELASVPFTGEDLDWLDEKALDAPLGSLELFVWVLMRRYGYDSEDQVTEDELTVYKERIRLLSLLVSSKSIVAHGTGRLPNIGARDEWVLFEYLSCQIMGQYASESVQDIFKLVSQSGWQQQIADLAGELLAGAQSSEYNQYRAVRKK